MKKILIISYYFPPFNSIASKRYGDMCKYMKNYGYEPYILTTNNTGDLSLPVPEKNIIRIGKFSTVSDAYVSKAQLKLWQYIIFLFFDTIKLQLKCIDLNSWSWYNQVSKKEKYISNKFPKFDIIIGTYGPISNVIIARYFSKKFNIP